MRQQLLWVPLPCSPGRTPLANTTQVNQCVSHDIQQHMYKLPEVVAAGGRRDAPTGTWLCSRAPTKWASRSIEGRTRQQVRQARVVTAAAAPAKAFVHVQPSADEQKRMLHASTFLMLQTHRVPSVSHKSVVGFVWHQKESTSRGTCCPPRGHLLTPCLQQARCRCHGACSSSCASC